MLTTIMIYTLAAIILIVAVIGIHEWGHLLVAKVFGVQVPIFSLGFGKPLLKYRSRGNTEYRLSVIPLGGYVKLLDEQEALSSNQDLETCYERQLPWKRMLILLAGPLANLLFAVCAFSLMLIIGLSSYKPIIADVVPQSLAAQSGVEPGDEIVNIGGWETPNWGAVMVGLVYYIGDEGALKFTVESNKGKLKQLSIPLEHWKLNALKPDLLASLGIQALQAGESQKGLYVLKKPIPEALVDGFIYTGRHIMMSFIVFGKLISGKISLESLIGPLGIFHVASVMLELGIAHYLEFLALLSIAVGLINLFPIPGLDGGQLLYLLIEKVRKRPVSMAVQLLAIRLCLIVFCLFLVQVMLNDVVRYFSST